MKKTIKNPHTICFRIEEDTYEKLFKMSHEDDRTVSNFLRVLIEKTLEGINDKGNTTSKH